MPFRDFTRLDCFIKKKIRIRESQFSWGLRDKLKPVKYILLFLMIIIPFLIANAGIHPDFRFPFCQICPAKPLMPVFKGNFSYFAIDMTNPITTVMTLLSIILASIILIGIIFKERFFCMICPLLALISLFDKMGLIQFRKKIDACIGCRNCQRVCPVDIRDVHQDKENILTQDCILCLKCIESCPQDNALSLKFLNKTIFSSSKKYILKYFFKKDGVNTNGTEK